MENKKHSLALCKQNEKNLKLKTMKQVFILIEKSEVENVNGFYNRKELFQFEADNLNAYLSNLIWVLQPNY